MHLDVHAPAALPRHARRNVAVRGSRSLAIAPLPFSVPAHAAFMSAFSHVVPMHAGARITPIFSTPAAGLLEIHSAPCRRAKPAPTRRMHDTGQALLCLTAQSTVPSTPEMLVTWSESSVVAPMPSLEAVSRPGLASLQANIDAKCKMLDSLCRSNEQHKELCTPCCFRIALCHRYIKGPLYMCCLEPGSGAMHLDPE